MYTKEQLKEHLELLKIDRKGTLLVHSSMKSIGDVIGGADTVLDALTEYMSEGLLVLPTHTWSYINSSNPVFDEVESKVCVGILPELFRQREGVVRSLHPTHSVAALGKDADEFIAGSEKYDTPCARQSPWGKLLDRNASVMLLGVDLTRNTFIHGVEEWLDIKGRLTDEPEQLYVVTKDKKKISVPQRRHHGDHWSEYFGKVDDFFLEHNAMYKGKFGDATVRICSTKETTKLLEKMLAINPNLFSNNEPLEYNRYIFD